MKKVVVITDIKPSGTPVPAGSKAFQVDAVPEDLKVGDRVEINEETDATGAVQVTSARLL